MVNSIFNADVPSYSFGGDIKITSEQPAVTLTSTPIMGIKLSYSANTKYAIKPRSHYFGNKEVCPHMRALMQAEEVTLDSYVVKIEEGRLFRHYYDSQEIADNALDVANRVSIEACKDDRAAAKHKRIIAYNKLSKGKMQCSYLCTRDIVRKYGSFQAVYFDIDSCQYQSATELVNHLNLPPNIIYEGYSYGKLVNRKQKNSYHLVYILDEVIPSYNYEDVYDTIKRAIKAPFMIDDAGRSATQLMYGTSNKAYIYQHNYYHIDFKPRPYNDGHRPVYSIKAQDVVNAYSTPTENYSLINEDSATHNAKDASTGLAVNNIFAIPEIKPPDGQNLWVSPEFIAILMSEKGTHHFLQVMEDKCVTIDKQCNEVTEPFVYNPDGLLIIKPYFTKEGKAVKLKCMDHRKKRARLLTQLFLTMCPEITPEDLVFNVVRVLNMTCDWSSQKSEDGRGNTYSNDVLLSQIRESYTKFKKGEPLFPDDLIEKFRDKRYKRCVNAYYVGLSTMCKKIYYRSRYAEAYYSNNNTQTFNELNKLIKQIHPYSNKGVPHSETGKKIIQLHNSGLKIFEISQHFKNAENKVVSKRQIRLTIKKYEETFAAPHHHPPTIHG